MENEQTCSKCKTKKKLDSFPKQKRGRLGVNTWCKSCMKDYRDGWWRAAKLRRAYKRWGVMLTMEQLSGSCEICGNAEVKQKWKILSIDHDHEEDEFRGLLCHGCNAGLGQFADNPDNLRRAAQYIENHNDRRSREK